MLQYTMGTLGALSQPTGVYFFFGDDTAAINKAL
jgi:hypothetical protein